MPGQGGFPDLTDRRTHEDAAESHGGVEKKVEPEDELDKEVSCDFTVYHEDSHV